MHNIKVREVVALGRFPYTNWIGSLTSMDEISVNEALEATGLMPLADRIIDNISDGEKQRALIARSLAQDTRLLVMDEPTAYLDLPSRYSIVSLLKKLTRERGKCVIYSTHDLDTAINEADKIWLMNEKGVDEGAPEDLMLSRTIARAFESPLLSFSQTSGTFSFVRKRQGTITLDANGSLRKITERALHRCGYRTEPDAAVRITAGETDGRTEWCLMYEGRTECFSSIYDLVCHLPEED
jgi:iron complex transport system ATP-binding protein